jgi:hypothetical protein
MCNSVSLHANIQSLAKAVPTKAVPAKATAAKATPAPAKAGAKTTMGGETASNLGIEFTGFKVKSVNATVKAKLIEDCGMAFFSLIVLFIYLQLIPLLPCRVVLCVFISTS